MSVTDYRGSHKKAEMAELFANWNHEHRRERNGEERNRKGEMEKEMGGDVMWDLLCML